jgi:hypothetical protein
MHLHTFRILFGINISVSRIARATGELERYISLSSVLRLIALSEERKTSEYENWTRNYRLKREEKNLTSSFASLLFYY